MPTEPVSALTDYSHQYGPLAFGLVSFLILFMVVWYVLIRPIVEQRGTDLDKIASIANAQNAMGENLRATADANAKATEDLKVIAKVHEAGMAHAERMTARLDRLAEKANQ